MLKDLLAEAVWSEAQVPVLAELLCGLTHPPLWASFLLRGDMLILAVSLGS